MITLIDTHQHLIYPDRFDYPWIGSVPALQKPFTLEDYASLTQDAGIEASVFMEVDVSVADMGKEAAFFMEQAETGEHALCGVIASARPEEDGFEAHLERIESPRLKGIRRVLHVVDDSLSQGNLFRENIRLLGQKALPFDLCMFPKQHSTGLELVDACPHTAFVLDHLGNPTVSDPTGFENWKQSIQHYAEREQMSAKLSGIVAQCAPGTVSLDVIQPYLDATLEAFGPNRLVWGSDWPVCNLTSSLPEWIQLFRAWMESLSEAEQSAIGHENARRIYRL